MIRSDSQPTGFGAGASAAPTRAPADAAKLGELEGLFRQPVNPPKPPANPAALARAAAAWPGGHLSGRFELKSVAVSTGAGRVYLGWDHQMSQAVAIKEYLPEALAQHDASGAVRPRSPDTAQEFQRGLLAFVDEARTLAQCHHPSLVRVLDIVEAGGTAYRVMPWYRGRVLLDARRKMPGPIGEPALRALLHSLLGAVEAYHQRRGVHGGIDPSQVLLLDDDHPMLLGPGTSPRTTRTESVGSLVRPPDRGAAPPEQAQPRAGVPSGPWTDVYALAALARFCIAGTLEPAARPAAREPLAAMVARLFGDSASVRYSAELLRTLDAALSPDIALRPQTAAQFRERLSGQFRTRADVPAAMDQAARSPRPVAADRPRGAFEPVAALSRKYGSATFLDPREGRPASAGLGALGETVRPPDAHAAATLRADPADRYPGSAAHDSGPRRSHRARWAGLAVVAMGGLAVAAWELLGRPSDVAGLVRPLHDVQQAQGLSAAPPSATPQTIGAAQPAQASGLKAPPLAGPPSMGAGTAPAASKSALAANPVTERAAAPRQECGTRTEFALYRCMQLQCSLAKWQRHPQCERFEATDSVD